MFNQSWIENPSVEEFYGLNLLDLERDEAYVIANSSIDNVGLYSASDDCVKCPYKLLTALRKGVETVWKCNTSEQYTWRFLNTAHEKYRAYNNRSGLICELRPTLGEFGVYKAEIGSCKLQTELEPVDITLPLITTGLLFLAVILLYMLYNLIRTNILYHILNKKNSTSLKEEAILERKILAIDIFLGIAIFLYIFLVCGAGGYRFFNHIWRGVVPQDVALSALAWSAGFTIPNMVQVAFKCDHSKLYVLYHILKMSLPFGIFDIILSSILEQNFDISSLWGPLEKLGIAYLIAGITYTLPVKKCYQNPEEVPIQRAITDVTSMIFCWVQVILLSAAYLILIYILTSYNWDLKYPSVNLPNASEYNGDTGHIVKIISGHDNPVLRVNDYFSFDKGVLGCITTTTYTLIGVQAGSTLLHYEEYHSRMKRWFYWAFNLAVVGASLAALSLQINFNLWSIGFTLLTAAAFQLVFHIVYLFTDVWNIWCDIPFYVLGRNTLLVLTGHITFGNNSPFTWDFIPMSTHFIFLMQNVWTIMLWIVICAYAVKKNIKLGL